MKTEFNFELHNSQNMTKMQLAFRLKKILFDFDFDYDTLVGTFSFKNQAALNKAKGYADVMINKEVEPNWIKL